MTVHNFSDSLKKAQEVAEAPWWESFYRRSFRNFESMVCVRKDGWAQRGGIDRVITLNSGKVVTVDEKVRDKYWPDFLLERYSDYERRTPGWMQKDLACDFIAYVWLPREDGYLLPFLLLRRAWLQHGQKWCREYPEKRGINDGYVTLNVAVPIDVVLKAVNQAMFTCWGMGE